MNKKKALITGGAGFIGSHLCEKMIADGYKVICLDNLDKYYTPRIKLNNIRGLKKLKDFIFVRADIRDQEKVNSVFHQHKLDLVLHLAAKVGVRPSISDPIDYYDTNIKGTLIILEACRRHNIKKLVFASSSSVYGLTKAVKFREDIKTDLPISPYAATKKTGEILGQTYYNLYGINIICLRLFTVYGPRQRPDLAIHKFTRLIYDRKPVSIFGDGTSKRDYTYIDDVIAGISKSVRLLEKTKKPLFEIINLGQAKPISLIDLLKLIQTKLKLQATVKKMAMQPGDLPHTFANIKKAKQLLAYQPKTTIASGIEKFISWFLTTNENM